jgi:anti-anti-sigma factor
MRSCRVAFATVRAVEQGRPTAAQAFDVEVREERAQVLVRVVGELDLVTAPVLDRHLAGAASRERPRVVVDLSGVTFLDVRGINSLVTAEAAARTAGSALVLRGADEQVHRLLEVCGLQDHFTLED